MTITYEWDIEEIDVSEPDEPEVLDHNHQDALKDYSLSEVGRINGATFCLVLVRNDHDRFDDLKDRQWAYAVRDGSGWSLPEFFQNAYEREECKVPKRFHEEISKTIWSAA